MASLTLLVVVNINIGGDRDGSWWWSQSLAAAAALVRLAVVMADIGGGAMVVAVDGW